MNSKQKSGANAPNLIGSKTVAHASNAGANRIKGGCTPTAPPQSRPGAMPQKSGNKGG